jgi:hypothetical protein
MFKGDEETNMKNKILEYYNIVAQTNPIDAYCLKYYKDVKLRVIDTKRVKN